MTCLKYVAASVVLPLIKRSIPASVLVLAFCFTGSAQSSQPAQLARLISEPGSERLHPAPSAAANSDHTLATDVLVATVTPTFDDATPIERRAFERTNEERVKVGLIPLVWDADLCRMARVHSESMARMNFFAHDTPEGLQLKDRARSLGILHFRVIAENIAYNKGYEDPGAFAVERWMISAGHRANILYVGFQGSAIGSFVSADGSVYLTQVFINR